MSQPLRLRAAALAALSTLIFANASARAQTEHHALAGDRVSIYNLAGKVKVQGGTGADVAIDVTRGGRDAAQLRIAKGDLRGASTLRVVYPGDRIVYGELRARTRTSMRVNADGTFDDRDAAWDSRNRVEIRDSGSGLEAHADMVISVPKGKRIVVHWGAGEATVSNVDGDIHVSVGAGPVASEHTRGTLRLDTGTGGLTVSDAQGTVSLETGSGGVTLNGIQGQSLDLDTGSGTVRGGNIKVSELKLETGSGGLRLDQIEAGRVSAESGSGGIELSFVAPVTDLTADAGSGGVTVRVPAAQGGEIDIETGSGGVDTDFAVTTSRLARNHLRGTIGTGKARIRIESGSGTVRLLKN